jgi:hypothetical protein
LKPCEARERRRWLILAAACAVLLGMLSPIRSVRAGDPSDTSTTPAVKLSRSGICHDSASRYFAKMKNYQPFARMEDCIAAGGRAFGAAAKRPSSPTDSPSSKESERRTDQDGSKGGIPVIAWLIVGGVVILVLAIPWIRRSRLRRRNQATEADFQEAAERRWQGHQRDRPEDPNQQGAEKRGD